MTRKNGAVKEIKRQLLINTYAFKFRKKFDVFWCEAAFCQT
jgi:hypothetical protein